METKFFVIRYDKENAKLVADLSTTDEQEANNYVLTHQTNGNEMFVVLCKEDKFVVVKWNDEEGFLDIVEEFDSIGRADKFMNMIGNTYDYVDDYYYDESGDYLIYTECTNSSDDDDDVTDYDYTDIYAVVFWGLC